MNLIIIGLLVGALAIALFLHEENAMLINFLLWAAIVLIIVGAVNRLSVNV